MVMRLIDPDKPVKWIHPDERDHPEDATVFHILALSEGTARKLKAAHPTRISEVGATLNESEIKTDMFLSQVVRIDNVVWPGASAGVSVSDREGVEKFLQMMPTHYSRAIYAAIENTGDLDEGDAKNFGGSFA